MIIDQLKKLRSGYRNYPGDVGIEIETETKDAYVIPPFSFWTVHQDGSLRDFGMEYILQQPLRVEDQIWQALEEFRDKTKGIKFIQDSLTTSVHIHLNFLNQNFQTLGNFLVLYTMFENILIRYSGEDRLSNLFCLPICDAEETYKNMMKMAGAISHSNVNGLIFNQDACKYAALNLSCLGNYGSLEVRSHKGTTNIDRIFEWINILQSIKNYAQQDIVPQQIITSWKDRGSEILTDVFGRYKPVLAYKDSTDLVERNFWYAANIAYAVKDWKEVFKTKDKTKSKISDLDHLAKDMFRVQRFEGLNAPQQRQILEMMANPNFFDDGDDAHVEIGIRDFAPPRRRRAPPEHVEEDIQEGPVPAPDEDF